MLEEFDRDYYRSLVMVEIHSQKEVLTLLEVPIAGYQ